MRRIVLALCILGCAWLNACKKDKTLSPKELLIGKWSFDQVGTIEAVETLKPMPAGSYFEFSEDGSLVLNVNGAFHTTWTIDDKQKQIDIENLIPGVYTIKKITADRMILYTEETSNGNTIKENYYFSKPFIQP